jgi:hypothetical protein
LARVLASCFALVAWAGVAAAAVQQLEVTRLPEPPWRSGAAPGTASVRLELVSARPNEITDEAAWFARNRLELREHRVPGGTNVALLRRRALPRGTPTRFRGQELAKAIRQRDTLLLAYGNPVQYLVASRGGKARYGFDFANYAHAPRGPGEYQSLNWAVERAGVLYVSHSHVTFARDTGGLNGYLTAIDLKTRKVRWRSRPLVANAETFEIVGNVVVTGYGFTEEPDYLYLLDRRTGGVVQRLPVPSAPEYILRRGRELYVRTYDRDLVVELTRRR